MLFKGLRREVSSRVHALSATDPDPTVFDILISPVEQYLRQQHAQFVCSEEFLDAFNRPDEFVAAMSTPKPPRMSLVTPTPSRKPRKSVHQPTLTAEMLLKTQYDRENALGESELEKLYPPAVKAPYVCNATTSKNDSAVSSTFSSDANGQNTTMKLSTIREEQLRGNPATHTLARVERVDCAAVPTHCTEEGRRAFANLLIEKLNVLSARRRRNDVMSQQLRDIEVIFFLFFLPFFFLRNFD
ncbi:Axin-like protein pry-1 [Toxocara canis]|uniref:Axin-like protein pry-1 n=1 Tax=Toxocara canis TaxID=6265 RepID=A0A0B2UQV6_TOXCA|nr:Axin-like protein pry-1 [Toxocara canis]